MVRAVALRVPAASSSLGNAGAFLFGSEPLRAGRGSIAQKAPGGRAPLISASGPDGTWPSLRGTDGRQATCCAERNPVRYLTA